MWAQNVFSLIAFLIVGSLAFEDNDVTERIFDSKPTAPTQFTYQVQISYYFRGKMKFWCSGAIVHARFVMTTADCATMGVAPPSAHQYILSGSTELNRGIKYVIQQRIRHPNFNEEKRENNIALLRTAKSIIFGPAIYVSIAGLPIADLKPDGGLSVTSSGWGTTRASKLFEFITNG